MTSIHSGPEPHAHSRLHRLWVGSSRWTRLEWLAVAMVSAITVWVVVQHVVFYFPRTVDDLFISLRYAERLVEGQGLTFNDGERVEGYSNPSWVFAQALLIALGIEGVTATKILSVLSLAGLFAGVAAFGRRVMHMPPLAIAVALLLVATNAYVISWAMWGLETPLYLALLLWCAVAMTGLVESPSRRRTLATAALVVALAMTRPEAALYVIAMGAALVVGGWSRGAPAWRGCWQRLRALVPAAASSALVIGVLVVMRRLYFGLWLPHTYYAKQGSGFDLEKLDPLFEQGAAASETNLLMLGLGLAVVAALMRRSLVPLAMMASCLFFVASVEVDWMPNQRHLLPLYLLAIVMCCWLPGAAWGLLARWRGQRAAATWLVTAAATALVAVPAYQTSLHWWRIDSRYSPNDFETHGRGEHWIREKTDQAWEDAWVSMRGEVPEHVDHIPVHDSNGGGMISQLFMVLEASSEPESEGWFIGRDIGRVGYYSPVQVFDTAALFTPGALAALHPPPHPPPPAESVAAAFDERHIIAGELLDGWHQLPPEVRRQFWGHGRIRRRDLPRPSAAQILARYDRVVEKFPTWFTLATLYGESVGGVVRKRHARVHELLDGLDDFTVDSVPPSLDTPRQVGFDKAVTLHGCQWPEQLVRGQANEVRCYWEKTRRYERDLGIFVHLDNTAGHVAVKADHRPLGGFRDLVDWEIGQIVSDRFWIEVPADLPDGELTPKLGLWDRRGRASARPVEAHTGDDRAVGPTLTVVSP